MTHSLPIPDEEFADKLEIVNTHFDNFQKHHSSRNANECTYYEFGAGYDMVIPMAMSLMGFNKLICIDVRELVFPQLINDSIDRLRKFKVKLKTTASLSENIPYINRKNYKEVLKKFFRIDYIAPRDARKTGIESDSVDFVLSNATMEHIPRNDLGDILKECFRILKKGGVMSNVIDYRDHWSFFDDSISVYNYLMFTDKKWNKLNPSIMFQNRMRHKDYIGIINETQFVMEKEKTEVANDSEFRELRKIKLDTYFRENYSEAELSIKSSMLVLKKPFGNP